MKFVKLITVLQGLLFGNEAISYSNETLREHHNNLGNCGVDKSPISVVYEGIGKIETYPWLGVLIYPSNDKRYITSVVLVTRQIVIASAMDIDKLPKQDFRARSRVVLGQNCSNPGIRVKDYSYHPDYNINTYSTLALIQLETNYLMTYLQPICAPPRALDRPRFYVMTIDDCKRSTIKIHKMAYVDPEQCKIFYKRTELDIEKMWPTHSVCAKALTGVECVWSSGAALVLRQNNKWSLIGLGIYGPGCKAPSRFLEYSQYKPWILNSIARIGRPTVSRISTSHIILRRSLSNVQRYGPCDPEEVKAELFTDRTKIERGPTYKKQRVRYNFTIFSNLEYSCVVFRVYHYKRAKWFKDKPYIRLKRWCQSPKPICYSFQLLQIDFAVEIFFKESVVYQVMAYGREVRLIDMKKLMGRVNARKPYPPVVVGAD
ncbi:unnamed protein product [Euphydryas editha]|uniref:Peptidase S1 domain-containing protein n=1 Tax=Euphydryas editha TaxID=104508 RepID=A0AAU9UJQ0_EUPED|nr:unnamed protein product [Euphydryas editha]